MRRFYRHPYKHNRGTLVSPGSGDHAGSQVAKSYIKICHPERSALERARVVEEPALSLPKGSLSSSRRSISRGNPARSSEFSPPQRTLAASAQGRAARDPSTPHGGSLRSPSCSAQDDKTHLRRRGRSVFQLRTLAGIHDFRGIDSVFIHLLFHNFSIFADQEVHAARSLVLVFVDAVLAGDFSAPIAQQRKRHSDLVGEGFVGKCTIHAHTQDLGVGCFQRFQILLECLHLLRSTTGERKDVKRHHDILLATVIA